MTSPADDGCLAPFGLPRDGASVPSFSLPPVATLIGSEGQSLEPALQESAASFVGACYAARRWSAPAGLPLLNGDAAQGLADLLPVLMCGEASAERAFASVVAAVRERLPEAVCAELASIASDEQRHGRWLADLRSGLPTPASRQPARRAARFLRQLASNEPAQHLGRVAALDSGVCMILAEVCGRHRPVSKSPALMTVFQSIRRDEGRHVRTTRSAARQLGLLPADEARERQQVLEQFADLLAPQSAAFAALGVDFAALRQRFLRSESAASES